MTDTDPRKSSIQLAGSVFNHYGQALQRYLLRRLRATQNVRDLEQEVYLRLLRVQDAELVRDPQAYMYRIASHVVHEFRQRTQTELVAFDSEVVAEHEAQQPAVSPDRLADELHAQRQLERVLKKLQPKWRAMFILHMRDGWSHEEVATKLNVSVHTVKKQMFRAFLALRDGTQRQE
jgi:RNA polymerase sigma factor (sigma-70 family)